MEDDGLSSSLSAELAAIGGAVRFRQAEDLEEEIREQFSHEFGDGEEERIDVNPINDLLRVENSVRHGDLTPLELLKAQNDRESGEREVKKEESLSDDEEEKEHPDPSTSRSRPFDDHGEDSEEYLPSDDGGSDEEYVEEEEQKGPKVKKRRIVNEGMKREKYGDDGDQKSFEARIRRYFAEKELNGIEEGDGEEERKIIKKDLIINSRVWSKLYKYQKTGIRWMAELREQRVGGVLADEMGLGKTVQTAVFLRAIAESKREEQLTGYSGLGPSLLVCPATLLQQWVKEMHIWHPLCRVAILHSCGSHRGSNSSLINTMASARSSGSLLITSYTTFHNERKKLTQVDWHYVILDEGHKIRNPEAQITMALKEVRTPYRLLLSGSPLQNSLKELWSLIDFVFPARLGTLQTFMEKFSIPITMGGYANATQIQSETAYKCALVLRDAINPFILRRLKKDVKMSLDLPNKNEQVLFCDLAPYQRSLYVEYLSSRECSLIRSGRLDSFSGLIILRKLCNHPDLVTGGLNKHEDADLDSDPSLAFGWPERSGKMQVVRSLLQLWKKNKDGKKKNKVLLFSQSRKMLTILEGMLVVDGHEYLRMDGTTPIGKRQNMVNEFNENSSIFIFLLTTRVGGVGVNLTAANKVVIFDPDWNPSTDAQARERAWRIGQMREVTVYRLMTTGTIEEKMYHRQIFKQFLANRVLKDPKQRRFLKTNHLHDLFTLTDGDSTGSTDTGAIFAGETREITKKNFFDAHEKEREKKRLENRKKRKADEEGKEEEEETDDEVGDDSLSDERRDALRKFAAAVSRDLSIIVPVKRKREEGEIEEKGEKSSLFEKKYKIPYLRKMKKGKNKEEKDESDHKGEDYVLSELLSRNGVRSVVKHDEVIGEGIKRSDERLLESQADTVAKQAAAAIRRRPKFNFLQQNGLIAQKGEKPSTSSSSVKFGDGKETNGGDLMEAIRERKRRQGAVSVPLPQSSKLTKLAEQVKKFLYSCPFSCARTEQIINRFKKDIPARDQLQFRSILKEVSHFDKISKEWQLKEEFR
ncbi:hypothetical protein PENTCL1PPCAC_17675 [Pristionchus entomophagus]|uniref:DNA repair and recombination protein RAD54-like n=1 Tax=Pristionchus entomophagus TaxID=358040 RepID=A0AAV5TM95_9BILA|nr:hypothetical protein PENTCL1PPCAC_17675 [Pristionchus entomophagus]